MRHNATLRPADITCESSFEWTTEREHHPTRPCLDSLPQHIICELLEYYIEYIHDKPHSLFHGPSLRREVKLGTIDRGLLCAILALAARFSPSDGIRSQEPLLANEAKQLLTADFEAVSLSKIQAWIVLGNVCGARNDYIAESLFFGIAIRTAFITGLTMPREDDNAVLAEIRSRVWWTLVMLDKWSSAGLGLPRQISDQQLPRQLPRSEIVFHDLPIDEELWPDGSNEPGLWAHMITLVQRFGPVQDLNRLLATDDASEAHIDLTVSRIAHEFEAWQMDLPATVRLSEGALAWHQSRGHGRTFVALHMGYYHYATLLLYQYLDRTASSLPHASTYAERCREHASGFSDLLRMSYQIPGCEAMYLIVGHMTVVSSSVLIHTLLFGDEAQVPHAKGRLESNFKILMKLENWWPSVTKMRSKLFRFQQACLDSVDERTHRVDRWMIKFLLEHGSDLGEKSKEEAQDTSPRSLADLDAAHWLSARNELTREALSHLQR